jgi:hypothetical protein
MKVNVTDGDINYGVQGSFCACPIALALKRKGLIDVQVNPDCVKFIKLNSDKTMDWYCYDLPSEAQVFIEDYDEEDDIGDLEPFDFELTKLNHKERVEVIDNVIQEVKGYENKSKV